MKRSLIIATTLALLGLAATAFASTVNTYNGTIGFLSKQPGTRTKPAPSGYTEAFTVHGSGSNRPGVLLDIKTKIYGFQEDGKDFPTCSLATIAAAKNDAGCPRGALVANGYVTAVLGNSADFTKPGSACDTGLHVWNSGQNKLTYFFFTNSHHVCLDGSIQTGDTGPFPGTYKTVGKYFEGNVPIPRFIDYPVPGLAASLQSLHLVWGKATKKVDGHTVAAMSSVACQAGKRPATVTLTSALPPSTAKSTASFGNPGSC